MKPGRRGFFGIVMGAFIAAGTRTSASASVGPSASIQGDTGVGVHPTDTEILRMYGLDDPLNVKELKFLLGLPV
jgi:hypothetical protein